MIRLLVPAGLITFRIEAPWRGANITFGIGIMGLFPGLDKLDESFTHYLAGVLSHLLEAGKVEALDIGFITDLETPGLLRWRRGIMPVRM